MVTSLTPTPRSRRGAVGERGKDHYTVSRNVADGIFAALTHAEDRERLLTALEKEPVKALTGLAKPDKATRDKLKKLPAPFAVFVATLVVRAVKVAAEHGAHMVETVNDPRGKAAADRMYTSAALSVGQQVGTWLGFGVTGQVLESGSFGDWLGGCALAIADLQRKEGDFETALERYLLCLAEIVLPGSTGSCGAEESNLIAAARDLEIAVNNFNNACGF